MSSDQLATHSLHSVFTNRPVLEDGKRRDNPSLDPRRSSTDSYRPNDNPPSRRQTDIMFPPAVSTPKVTSSPIKSDMGRLQLPTLQPPLPLIDNLNAFAQSIMSTASLTVRRDLAKQHAIAQRREHDRQSKFRSTFLTLTETAQTTFDDSEKTSMEIEHQIKLNSQAHSQNVVMLAGQLQQQNEVSDAQSSAHYRTRPKDEDYAELKMDLQHVKKEVGRFEDDLAALKEAVMPNSLSKKLGDFVTKDELRGLVVKDDIMGLVTKDELHRVATDQAHKQVAEALKTTEEKLGSMTIEATRLNLKIEAVETCTHEHCETSDAKDLEQSSQIGRQYASINKSLMDLELAIQEQDKNCAAVKIDLGAQEKVLTSIKKCVGDPSNGIPSLDERVMRLSDQVADIQSDLGTLLEEEKFKDANVAQEFETIQEDIKGLKAGLTLAHTDIKKIRQTQPAQTLPNHPPTPPFASVSINPQRPDQQTLQGIEMAIRNLTNTTQGLEVFINSQQQKFDGLTNYVGGILQQRLANIESQIAAQVGLEPSFQEVRRLTVDTRKNCSAAINDIKQDIKGIGNMKRDIEGLKEGPSDYRNRIDQLGQRVSSVEAKYVKAIGDLRTNQTHLVRKVTHLEQQDEIAAARTTPVEVTVKSRSSKSVQPSGVTTISYEYTNDSDSSDTPLSQRAGRGLPRDSEDARTPSSNPKRKTSASDDEEEAEGGEGRPTYGKRIVKRRHVSGPNAFS